MPLLMHLEINHPHGEPDVWCPVVVCDWCGRRIARAEDGNDAWGFDREQRTDGRLWFTHKRCCHPFAQAHADRFWSAEALDRFPLSLIANLAMAIPAEWRREAAAWVSW